MFFELSDVSREDLFEFAGFLGVLAYICNYTALSLRILSSECLAYFVINTSAACLVMVSLTQNFNMAAALIQGFGICIGTLAILIRLHRVVRRRIAARLGPVHTAHLPPGE